MLVPKHAAQDTLQLVPPMETPSAILPFVTILQEAEQLPLDKVDRLFPMGQYLRDNPDFLEAQAKSVIIWSPIIPDTLFKSILNGQLLAHLSVDEQTALIRACIRKLDMLKDQALISQLIDMGFDEELITNPVIDLNIDPIEKSDVPIVNKLLGRASEKKGPSDTQYIQRVKDVITRVITINRYESLTAGTLEAILLSNEFAYLNQDDKTEFSRMIALYHGATVLRSNHQYGKVEKPTLYRLIQTITGFVPDHILALCAAGSKAYAHSQTLAPMMTPAGPGIFPPEEN